MELHALQRMADTHAFVHKGKRVIPIKRVASFKMVLAKVNVAEMVIAQTILLVCTVHASAHVQAYAVAQMHTVNQKNMLVGAAVALALLKQLAVNVFHVSIVTL